MPGKLWTNEEIKFLIDNRIDMTISEIAIKLGRSFKGTKDKAITLKIGREYKYQKRCERLMDQQFNRLKILQIYKNSKSNRMFCKAKCDCGKIIDTELRYVEEGFSKSCGCLRKERQQKTAGYVSYNQAYLNCKRIAKTRKKDFKLTKEEFKSIVVKKCHYCESEGVPFNRYMQKNGKLKQKDISQEGVARAWINITGIDRVDNNIGYIDFNCVPCCKDCNFAKHSKTLAEFEAWLNRVIIARLKKLGIELTELQINKLQQSMPINKIPSQS